MRRYKKWDEFSALYRASNKNSRAEKYKAAEKKYFKIHGENAYLDFRTFQAALGLYFNRQAPFSIDTRT